MATKRKTAPSELEEAVEKYLPFVLEIRKRLLFVIALFLLAVLLGFIYYEKIVTFCLSLFNLEGVNIVFTSPFQFLSLALNTGVLVGILVVFPLLIIQILAFLKPALAPREFRMICSLIPISIGLFIGGFAFGVLIMRYVIIIFYEKTLQLQIGNFIDITLLISQILTTALLMGLAFQFPVILTVLMKLGVVSYKFISGKRPVAYAISLVFATLLPPTDIISLVFLTVPLLVLFELTLIANKFFLRVNTQ